MGLSQDSEPQPGLARTTELTTCRGHRCANEGGVDSQGLALLLRVQSALNEEAGTRVQSRFLLTRGVWCSFNTRTCVLLSKTASCPPPGLTVSLGLRRRDGIWAHSLPWKHFGSCGRSGKRGSGARGVGYGVSLGD